MKIEGKWGFIDPAGHMAIEPRYDRFQCFSEGRCLVHVDETWTFIDTTGKALGPPGLQAARSFSEGLAAVRIGGEWGYINRDMQVVIPPQYEQAWGFTEGLAPVRVAGKWGFIDRTGKVAIEPRYFWVDHFSEGLARAVGADGHEGYIDTTGVLIIARRFWDATPFTGGVAAVVLESGGRWGLIDKAGKVVAEPKFEGVGLFADGLAPARIEVKPDDSRWGYIDTTGKIVIEPRFGWADRFNEGRAEVALEGGHLRGYIDGTGRYVWGPTDPNWREDTSDAGKNRRIMNPVTQARVEESPTSREAEVERIGNPLKRRYPDGSKHAFARNVWDMILYEGRIFIGSGDWIDNAGPVDIYSFEPGTREFKLEYTAPDEMVSKFCTFDGRLVVPGNDPREGWDLGNLYIKDSARWRKVRTIPDGVHCFDIAYRDGRICARIGTAHTLRLLESADWGGSWTPIAFDKDPNTLFTWRGGVHGLNWDNHLCTLTDGILFDEMMTPKRATVLRDVPSDYLFGQVFHFDEVTPFTDDIAIATHGSRSYPQWGPFPPAVLRAGEVEPAVLEPFLDTNAMDVWVDGDTFFMLCTTSKADQYENAIYATKDAKTWRCVVRFTTETFARSMARVGGQFYIGLGCNARMETVPAATGDILQVIPR